MTPPPRDGREQRIRELDGWRAISVALVIVAHFAVYHSPHLQESAGAFGHIIRNFGGLGVDVFFVISGFVICRLLILEERRYGTISLKGFYRRIFRILPPFFLFMAVIATLIAAGLIREEWRQVAISSAFLANVRFLPQSYFVGHIWSLSVEEQFYLIFPTLWILIPRLRRGPIFFAVFSLCVLWSLTLVGQKLRPLFELESRAGFCCICCGVLLAIYESRVRQLAARVPALLVVIATCVLLFHPTASSTWQDDLYASLVIPPLVGLLLMSSLERGAVLRSVLCSRPMQAIGLTSYGIYLWQQLFTANRENYLGSGVLLWYGLPLLLIIVPLSYRFVELPAMRYGKTWSTRAREALLARKAIPASSIGSLR
jgi:peptidoglycan/LPS O-acetylase OafA/YrhL